MKNQRPGTNFTKQHYWYWYLDVLNGHIHITQPLEKLEKTSGLLELERQHLVQLGENNAEAEKFDVSYDMYFYNWL